MQRSHSHHPEQRQRQKRRQDSLDIRAEVLAAEAAAAAAAEEEETKAAAARKANEASLMYNAVPDPPELINVGERFVLLKLGDVYLRHKESPMLSLRKVKPPLVPPVPRDPRTADNVYPRRYTTKFRFEDYTFCMTENYLLVDCKLGDLERHLHNANFSVLSEGKVLLLVAQEDARGGLYINLDPLVYGSEWRLHAVGADQYVAESAQYAGWCLSLGNKGLCMTAMTDHEWSLLDQGTCEDYRRLTVVDLPEFAFTAPAVQVYCVSRRIVVSVRRQLSVTLPYRCFLS